MVLAFGDHQLDIRRRELRRGDELIALEPKAFDLLAFLIQHRDRVVSKDDLLQGVWGGRIVSESALTTRINAVRRALGDDGTAQRLVRTFNRRGIRFVGEVSEISDAPAPALAAAASITQPVVAPPPISIIVLPFVSLSNDPELQYFADGITEDLTTDLSRIRHSFVIAHNTALTYKGKPVDVKQLGRDLGVRYAIEGSVRRMGDQTLVNVQLIDGETGAHLWADRFGSDCRNLSEAQSAIAGRLAWTLNVEVTKAAGRRIERESGSDPEACDLIIRASGLISGGFSEANTQAALSLYEQALRKDPGSIDAKIGIARALTRNLGNGWSKSIAQDEVRSEQYLLEAIERDPNDAPVHRYMGALRRCQNRLAEARVEYETALALDPSDNFAVRNLGIILIQLGQPELAIPYFEKSIGLSPHDSNVVANYISLGRCHLFLGETDQAIDLLIKARAENPKHWHVHLNLAGALGLRGDLLGARSALAETTRLKPDMNSLAAYFAQPMFANPAHRTLFEKTVAVGLRSAGFPDE